MVVLMQKVNINKIKPNPKNPRIIKDDKFRKLVKSIEEFPQMLEKRPLVCFTDVDDKLVVLGGNMRLKAAKEVGLKELPVMIADDWTEEQKNEFLIKDNVGFGEWDWDQLAEWDSEQLEDWGLNVPEFAPDVDYSEKNKELNLNDFEDQKYTIKLEFTEDDYNLVKERLQELGQTPEKILYDALISL
jgi:ParB-like chromosome segregation protein Spo0J